MSSQGSLPLEVIDAIIGKLCLHCTSKGGACHGDMCASRNSLLEHNQREAEEHLRVPALLSLCLTSRAFSAIATRHLYHRPDCRKWWLLARTLRAREDLHRYVRFLDTNIWGYLDRERENAAIDIMSYYPAGQSPRENIDAMWDSPTDRAARLEMFEDPERMIELDLLCSLCPDLERLHIRDGLISGDDQPFVRLPGSMEKLRHVEIEANDDPEWGYNVLSASRVFIAAPGLTSLRLVGAGACHEEAEHGDLPKVELESVAVLELDWCDLNAEAFGAVLRLCPNLERLTYESAGLNNECSESFNIRQAKEAVLEAPCVESLKTFHLNLSQIETALFPDWEDVDVEQEAEEAKAALAARGIELTFVPPDR